MIEVFLVLVALVAVMVAVGWTMVLLGSAFTSFNPRNRYVLYPVTESRRA